MLDDDLLQEFMELHERLYGERLDRQAAVAVASALLELVTLKTPPPGD